MREKIFRLFTLVLSLVCINWMFEFQGINVNAISETKLSRKIIVFDSEISKNAKEDKLLKKYELAKIKDLTLVNGAVVNILSSQIESLSKEEGILRIDDDAVISICEKNTGKLPPQSSQVIPWGISAIGANSVTPSATINNIKVAIIDTGIELSHPDLKSVIKGGTNTINSKKSYKDDNGHGSHVSGIIGAINNTIGVVGGSQQVDLYSVKALDSTGNGYVSDVIEGLDWSIKNSIKVVNMSLGINTDIQSLHDAVIRANEAGLIQVAAAGNSYGGATSYPASYPEVISVSAVDSNNNISAFSSIGKIDLAAPGVSILSTYVGSTYSTLNGTSMAAPHVTSTVTLVLANPWVTDIDKNGICSPAEVLQRLKITATDLGTSGQDDRYGWGLINSYKAVYN